MTNRSDQDIEADALLDEWDPQHTPARNYPADKDPTTRQFWERIWDRASMNYDRGLTKPTLGPALRNDPFQGDPGDATDAGMYSGQLVPTEYGVFLARPADRPRVFLDDTEPYTRQAPWKSLWKNNGIPVDTPLHQGAIQGLIDHDSVPLDPDTDNLREKCHAAISVAVSHNSLKPADEPDFYQLGAPDPDPKWKSVFEQRRTPLETPLHPTVVEVFFQDVYDDRAPADIETFISHEEARGVIETGGHGVTVVDPDSSDQITPFDEYYTEHDYDPFGADARGGPRDDQQDQSEDSTDSPDASTETVQTTETEAGMSTGQSTDDADQAPQRTAEEAGSGDTSTAETQTGSDSTSPQDTGESTPTVGESAPPEVGSIIGDSATQPTASRSDDTTESPDTADPDPSSQKSNGHKSTEVATNGSQTETHSSETAPSDTHADTSPTAKQDVNTPPTDNSQEPETTHETTGTQAIEPETDTEQSSPASDSTRRETDSSPPTTSPDSGSDTPTEPQSYTDISWVPSDFNPDGTLNAFQATVHSWHTNMDRHLDDNSKWNAFLEAFRDKFYQPCGPAAADSDVETASGGGSDSHTHGAYVDSCQDCHLAATCDHCDEHGPITHAQVTVDSPYENGYGAELGAEFTSIEWFCAECDPTDPTAPRDRPGKLSIQERFSCRDDHNIWDDDGDVECLFCHAHEYEYPFLKLPETPRDYFTGPHWDETDTTVVEDEPESYAPNTARRLGAIGRGWSEQAVNQAHIGWVPGDKRETVTELLDTGFSISQLLATGLFKIDPTGIGHALSNTAGYDVGYNEVTRLSDLEELMTHTAIDWTDVPDEQCIRPHERGRFFFPNGYATDLFAEQVDAFDDVEAVHEESPLGDCVPKSPQSSRTVITELTAPDSADPESSITASLPHQEIGHGDGAEVNGTGVIYTYGVFRKTKYRSQAQDYTRNAKYRKPASREYTSLEEPIYGTHTITEGEPLLVTEGIADAVAAHSYGIPTISPVTTQFKADHWHRLTELVEKYDVPRVDIVQDNEPPSFNKVESVDDEPLLTDEQIDTWKAERKDIVEAGPDEHPETTPLLSKVIDMSAAGPGELGAVRTLSHLEDKDIDGCMITLPKAGDDKIDLDDYLSDQFFKLAPLIPHYGHLRENTSDWNSIIAGLDQSAATRQNIETLWTEFQADIESQQTEVFTHPAEAVESRAASTARADGQGKTNTNTAARQSDSSADESATSVERKESATESGGPAGTGPPPDADKETTYVGPTFSDWLEETNGKSLTDTIKARNDAYAAQTTVADGSFTDETLGPLLQLGSPIMTPDSVDVGTGTVGQANSSGDRRGGQPLFGPPDYYPAMTAGVAAHPLFDEAGPALVPDSGSSQQGQPPDAESVDFEEYGDDHNTADDQPYSQMYDLTLSQLIGMDPGERGKSPLGHTGESENYFKMWDENHGKCFKRGHTLTALNYMAYKAGVRTRHSITGEFSDEEILDVWVWANTEGPLSRAEYDKIPHRASIAAAKRYGIATEEDVVTVERTDGRSFQSLPAPLFKATVDRIESTTDITTNSAPQINSDMLAIESVTQENAQERFMDICLNIDPSAEYIDWYTTKYEDSLRAEAARNDPPCSPSNHLKHAYEVFSEVHGFSINAPRAVGQIRNKLATQASAVSEGDDVSDRKRLSKQVTVNKYTLLRPAGYEYLRHHPEKTN